MTFWFLSTFSLSVALRFRWYAAKLNLRYSFLDSMGTYSAEGQFGQRRLRQLTRVLSCASRSSFYMRGMAKSLNVVFRFIWNATHESFPYLETGGRAVGLPDLVSYERRCIPASCLDAHKVVSAVPFGWQAQKQRNKTKQKHLQYVPDKYPRAVR